MSAAAQNRGSAVISRQIDAEMPSPEMTILRDLTELSRAHAGTVVFAATVIRFASTGRVWLMNREHGGWNQRGYVYDSIWTLAREWRLAFVGFGRDEHSRFIRVEPLSRLERPS